MQPRGELITQDTSNHGLARVLENKLSSKDRLHSSPPQTFPSGFLGQSFGLINTMSVPLSQEKDGDIKGLG